MTNREQIAFSINFSEYEDSEVAEQLCEMINAIGGIAYSLKKPLTKWLGLECDFDNNWGELEEKERADYYEEEDEE